jgi:hypothetical protein
MDAALLPCCFHVAAPAHDKETTCDLMLVEVAVYSVSHRSLPPLDPPMINSQLSVEVGPTPVCSEEKNCIGPGSFLIAKDPVLLLPPVSCFR